MCSSEGIVHDQCRILIHNPPIWMHALAMSARIYAPPFGLNNISSSEEGFLYGFMESTHFHIPSPPTAFDPPLHGSALAGAEFMRSATLQPVRRVQGFTKNSTSASGSGHRAEPLGTSRQPCVTGRYFPEQVQKLAGKRKTVVEPTNIIDSKCSFGCL